MTVERQCETPSAAAMEITRAFDEAGLLRWVMTASQRDLMQRIIDAAMQPEREAAERLAEACEAAVKNWPAANFQDKTTQRYREWVELGRIVAAFRAARGISGVQ